MTEGFRNAVASDCDAGAAGAVIRRSDAAGAALPAHWVDVRADARPAPANRGWLRALGAVAEVLFATADGPPPAARIAWLKGQADDFFPRIGRKSRVLFRLSLGLVTWVAPILAWRPLCALRWLSPATRARAISRYERSPLGLTLLAVKAMLCILYYEHPDAAAEMGFDGRCMGEDAGAASEDAGGGA